MDYLSKESELNINVGKIILKPDSDSDPDPSISMDIDGSWSESGSAFESKSKWFISIFLIIDSSM